jgi:hypothetical protein
MKRSGATRRERLVLPRRAWINSNKAVSFFDKHRRLDGLPRFVAGGNLDYRLMWIA